MMNTDYPAGNPTLNLVPFDDPPIEQCTLTTTRIIDPSTKTDILDGNGRPRIYTNQVLEKTGGTSTIDDQYRNHNPNDDIDIDSDSDIDIDSDSDSGDDAVIEATERGYLYIPNEDHELMQTLYGGVYRGNVLERDDNDNWQKTEEECVIKALGWDKIIAGREEGRVEDPRTEIAAMILLWNCYNLDRPVADRVDFQNVTAAEVREAMRQTNIIMPLDFLYDNENLYIIMPLCSEGKILDCVPSPEETCRTYTLDTPSLSGVFPQMLNGHPLQRVTERNEIIQQFPPVGRMDLCMPDPVVHSSYRDMYNGQDVEIGKLVEFFRSEGVQREQCTDLALKLLQNMLQSNDLHRLCLQQIRTHQWLSQTT